VDSKIDWSKVWVFFVDERNVAHGSPDSNVGAATEALLGRVPVPKDQVGGARGGGGRQAGGVGWRQERRAVRGRRAAAAGEQKLRGTFVTNQAALLNQGEKYVLNTGPLNRETKRSCRGPAAAAAGGQCGRWSKPQPSHLYACAPPHPTPRQVIAIKEGLTVQQAATEYEGRLLGLPSGVLPRGAWLSPRPAHRPPGEGGGKGD
jgi:hypothetical protein